MAGRPEWTSAREDLPAWADGIFTDAQLGLPPVLRWQLCIRMLHCRPAVGHVGLVVATYMNASTLEARPSISKLAADTGRKPETVRQALRELEDRGWLGIKRNRNPSTGQHFTNEYVGTKPEADVEVEWHLGGKRPMRIHQAWPRDEDEPAGACCTGGYPPKGAPLPPEGDPPYPPKGTHVPPEGDPPLPPVEGDEVSKGCPEGLPEKCPDSERDEVAPAPDQDQTEGTPEERAPTFAPGSSPFEKGRAWADLLADGQVTATDVEARSEAFDDDHRAAFLAGVEAQRRETAA